MDLQSRQVMTSYISAYSQLYKKVPRDLRILDNNWVSINGAKMHITELEFLTRQLEKEYQQGMQQEERKTIVTRLLKWFKQ